ncbi:MAG TPA: hypothetical protein VGR01_16000 [Burkholderiales bacterium]|nr:hypothetical protein [Burkholderiales bacterium]
MNCRPVLAGKRQIRDSAADEFLATHGGIWDIQWDMFFALCGAMNVHVTCLSGLAGHFDAANP